MSENKKEKQPAYVPLKDWETKTLLQDVETSGYSIDDVDVDMLLNTTKNPEFYGVPRNKTTKDRRVGISARLQDFKRKSAPNYLKYVRGWGVTPSPFTIQNAEAVAASAKAAKKKPDEAAKKAPNMANEGVDNVSSSFASFGFADIDSFDDEPPPPKTPPRVFKSPAAAGFGAGIKSPNVSPFRNSKTEPTVPVDIGTYSTESSTVTSTFTTYSAMPAIVLGTYEFPHFFKIIRGFSGRYLNGIWVVEENKMVKLPTGKNTVAYKYCGYLFYRGVNAPDVYLFSCFIADKEYVRLLVQNKIVSPEDADKQFVVFREPNVSSYDRVGKGGIIAHQWVSTESKEAVRTVHTNIKPASEEDDSPGPSWLYTVAEVPEECPLDNRVFSDHNFIIEPYESMPPKTKMATLGDEETLAFHLEWRVAIEGTETAMDESDKMTLAERMKKRRQEHSQRS